MSKTSDNPERLSEYIGANVTKKDVALIKRVMGAMGVSKADAIRMLLRAGAQSGRWNTFLPNDEGEPS